MKCEFRLADGSLNLDLTTKILRTVATQVMKTVNDTNQTNRNQYCAITGTTKLFYAGDTQVSLIGALPPAPTPPFMFTPLRQGAFKFVTAQDNSIHWNTIWGTFADTINTQRTFKYPVESWANEQNVQFPDYMRIRDSSSALLWSTATLGDAVFRVGQVQLSALNTVASFTSPNNRRLYVLVDETFTGGTYTEDDTGNTWSASGLQYRFRNNGRTVDVCYASYYEGDISAWFAAGNVSIINFFEVYGDT